MPNSVSTSNIEFERRHEKMFSAAARALSNNGGEHLLAKFEAMCGRAHPIPTLSGSHLAGRNLCYQLFDSESARLGTFDDQQSVVIRLQNTAWDTSTFRPIVDVERCRKDSRATLKRLLPSFLTFQQIRIAPETTAPDGGEVLETRIMAVGSGPGLHDRIDEACLLYQRDFQPRAPASRAIGVRRIENRRRDRVWAGALVSMFWEAKHPGPKGDTETGRARDLRALRRLQIEAMLNLRDVTFGFDRGAHLRDSMIGCATKQLEVLAKGERGPLHRDEIPQFIAEINCVIGKPEWLVPFAPNRK